MPKKIIYWDITIPNSMGPGYDIIASFAKKQHAQRASLGKHDYGQNANVREQKLILFPSLEEYKEVLKKKVLTDDEIIENVWNQLHAGKSLKDLTEFEQEIFASVERNK